MSNLMSNGGVKGKKTINMNYEISLFHRELSEKERNITI